MRRGRATAPFHSGLSREVPKNLRYLESRGTCRKTFSRIFREHPAVRSRPACIPHLGCPLSADPRVSDRRLMAVASAAPWVKSTRMLTHRCRRAGGEAEFAQKCRQVVGDAPCLIGEDGWSPEYGQRQPRMLHDLRLIRLQEPLQPRLNAANLRCDNICIDPFRQCPDETVLIAKVVVKGHGVDPGSFGQGTHGERIGAFAVKDFERRREHRLGRDTLLVAGGPPALSCGHLTTR